MDNCGKSRANTCIQACFRTSRILLDPDCRAFFSEGVFISEVNLDNIQLSFKSSSERRWSVIQASALSTIVGSRRDYQGDHE